MMQNLARHLKTTYSAIIALFLSMACMACDGCLGLNNPAYSLEREEIVKALTLEVDETNLKGDDQSFQLTIKNISDYPVELKDYQLNITAKSSKKLTDSDKLCFKNTQGKVYVISLDKGLPIENIQAFMKQILAMDDDQCKLKPGVSLTLPEFEIFPSPHIKDITINFELFASPDQKETATVDWQWEFINYDSYNLKILAPQKLLIGDETATFTICNKGNEPVDTDHITVQLEVIENDTAAFQLGSQAGKKTVSVRLSKLLGQSKKLNKNETTPPIAFKLSQANCSFSAEIRLALYDKKCRKNLFTSSAIRWYHSTLSLEGPDDFINEQVALEIKSWGPVCDMQNLNLYLKTNQPLTVTVNHKQINANGTALSELISGSSTLPPNKEQDINISIHNNNNIQASIDIFFEIYDENQRLLTGKKVTYHPQITKEEISRLVKSSKASQEDKLTFTLLKIKNGHFKKSFFKQPPYNECLYQAARSTNPHILDVINTFLILGADFKQKDENGKTPLDEAIENNRTETINFLRQKKAI